MGAAVIAVPIANFTKGTVVKMITAKNNIIVKIDNSKKPEYAILNPISGSFDLMDDREYDLLQKISRGQNPDNDFASYLLERGYAYKSEEEQNKAINKAYEEFKREVAQSQVQLMLVPTYGCNMACIYCYQGKGKDPSSQDVSLRPEHLISKETVDAFFDYARANFRKGPQKPFITLFGGEPLVNSPAQREIIRYIVGKCTEEDYELAAVTNGYDFMEYIDILKKARIKEVQFTLDGSKDVHDSRRATANKKGTFDRVIAGIQAAVTNKMPVNLRSVVDMENIGDIINLAEFLDEKGWLDLPPELFKTQIGRNYELFDCYAKPQHLMTQVELWGEFAALSKEYPVLSKFHRPDFKGIRHLVDTGEMYMASFDTCPACKTEWVFDLYGNIYGCTASCGREEYLLGSFAPEIRLYEEKIKSWQTRDVKSIPKCRDCKYDAICGGGCGVVVAGRNGGDVLSPDCRPIQELMEIGINHYIDDIRSMSAEETQQQDNIKQSTCCTCGTSEPRKTEGCMICGKPLEYSAEKPTKEICNICGRQFETYVKCPDGHYICDSCHSKDILGKVGQFLASRDDKNPVTLARKVFELPGLNMHGPEYHSIVPAVLVAALQNLRGQKDLSKIMEAAERGRDIKGGSCGIYGSCGAGIGAGIAVAVIEGTTPMSRSDRGAANRAAGRALYEISKHEGPRCCKREAVTSIQTFIEETDYFGCLDKEEYFCRQSGKNRDCIGKKCPFFPIKKTK